MTTVQQHQTSDILRQPDFSLHETNSCIALNEESHLLRTIDSQPWLTDLKRRVQHYGYRYDYSAREVTEASRLDPLPDWLAEIGARLVSEGHFEREPDQVIINEYLPGQGIEPHIDRETCFGPTISTLSLSSAITMNFTHAETGERVSERLEPRSLLTLKGDARYKWRHGIAPRKSDMVEGARVPRGRRVSLTFRTVLL